MDTSETYIKMRLAAIPDLKMGEPPCVTMGFPIHYMDVTTNTWVDKRGNWYHSTENEAVQLERQDQLQGMFGDYQKCLDQIHNFQCPEGNGYQQVWYTYCTSMEQLWLAFVMKEKYNKMWDGTKWEKNA